MAYAVVYRGTIIGHTDLEFSSGEGGMVSGKLRPTRNLAAVEKELRPYARAQVKILPGGGPPSWTDGSNRKVGALEIAIMDDKGKRQPFVGARVFWPGDIPGRNYLGVLALRGGLVAI